MLSPTVAAANAIGVTSGSRQVNLGVGRHNARKSHVIAVHEQLLSNAAAAGQPRPSFGRAAETARIATDVLAIRGTCKEPPQLATQCCSCCCCCRCSRHPGLWAFSAVLLPSALLAAAVAAVPSLRSRAVALFAPSPEGKQAKPDTGAEANADIKAGKDKKLSKKERKKAKKAAKKAARKAQAGDMSTVEPDKKDDKKDEKKKKKRKKKKK